MSNNTKRGDPERFFAEVVLMHQGDDCLTWPFTRPGGTYGTIRRGAFKKRVHRLVCEVVNGPPPTTQHQAAHSCGRGLFGCVSPKHLSWKTCAENQADKRLHGTMAQGERNGSASLTEDQARAIRQREIVFRDAASAFGVSKTQFYSIARGDSWSYLNDL